MSVKIIADSTCDLTQELIQKYEISIVPLHVMLGEKEYLDGKNITPDELYQWSDAHKTTPTTSAPAVEDVEQLFRERGADGSDLICFTISEQMSTTANVMRLAAEEAGMADRVFVVDSANLSTGEALMIIEASLMAQQGMDAQAIVARIEQLKPRVRASFVVDTLTYLHRGGRCSSVAALAGGALKLHPRIVVENGTMSADKKYRGKMSKVLFNYTKDMEEQLKNAKADRVFITHSGCEDSIIEEIYSYLKSLNRFEEILITRAGSVISSHCGPGTLGVLFIEGNN